MNGMSAQSDGVLLSLRVVPRASRDRIAEVVGDAIKVRLQAPPVEGKANQALVRFLAEVLDVSAARVRIVGGERGRNKRVRIAGVTSEQVQNAFDAQRRSPR